MKFIILVVILFVDGAPINKGVWIGTDLAECEKARARAVESVKDSPLTEWSRCIEIERGVKPQVDPKHRDPQSERKS